MSIPLRSKASVVPPWLPTTEADVGMFDSTGGWSVGVTVTVAVKAGVVVLLLADPSFATIDRVRDLLAP